MIVLSLKYSCVTAFNSKNKNKKFQINSAVTHDLTTIKQNTPSGKHFLQISMILIISNQFWVPLLQTQKRRNNIYTETNWLLQNRKIIVNCKFKMLPLSSHIISKLYDSFFHTITNSKKLNPSKTQWYYVAIIQNNSLQAFSS